MKNKYIYLVVYNEWNYEDPDDDFREIIGVTTDYQTALQFTDKYAKEHKRSTCYLIGEEDISISTLELDQYRPQRSFEVKDEVIYKDKDGELKRVYDDEN